MKIDIPRYVRVLLERLENEGFAAYLVGGCVRDSLLGRPVHDYDATTSASPEDMKRLWKDHTVILTGEKHGTVTVLSEGHPVEITTFRIESKYSDGRHPDSVRFSANVEDDLSRRDFTMNAMAYRPKDGLTDCFGGREDLAKRRIRCVGDPQARFEEDGLRILRALRFAAVYAFALEENTEKAVFEKKECLHSVSAERIFAEMTRLLEGIEAGRVIRRYSQVLTEIFPELAYSEEEWERAGSRMDACAGDGATRWAVLFSGLGEKTACETMRRMTFDHKTYQKVQSLLSFRGEAIPSSKTDFLKMLNRKGIEPVRWWTYSMPPESAEIMQAWLNGLTSGDCWSLDQLAVNGKDLIQAGIPEGKALGLLLEEALDEVMMGRLANQSQTIMEWIRKRTT